VIAVNGRAFATALFTCALVVMIAHDADAQRGGGGRGGGGGFSRGGMAGSGAFAGSRMGPSQMPAPRIERPATPDRPGLSGDRIQTLPSDPARGDRIQNLPQNPERREQVQNVPSHPDCTNNCWDADDVARAAIAVRAARAASAVATSSVLTTMPCSVAPVSVNEVPYYNCSGTWYAPGYANEGVVYQVVPPPPGY
jgi:hypothetical protein